jgi:A/G-specific adenine glycosylase
MPAKSLTQVSHKILRWFEQHARELPWRNPSGSALPLDDPDWPYRVWLSEIMLQQTQVITVKPYFQSFTTRWPSVRALAEAEDADVMAAWAGLGYYARARNMLACARAVAERGFPCTEGELRSLPGIGDYTAAAIASIAFGQHAVVVDGNVERVAARLFAEPDKAKLKPLAASITPQARSGDFAQAMMDLGATICTPRSPACGICPISDHCAGRLEAEAYPAKRAKPAKPQRTGKAWWIEQDGKVLLVRRPAKGLLGGMRALPSCDWKTGDQTPPFEAEWQHTGTVAHVFTHFALSLEIFACQLKSGCASQLDGEWWPKARIEEAGLPSLFAKAARTALEWGEFSDEP